MRINSSVLNTRYHLFVSFVDYLVSFYHWQVFPKGFPAVSDISRAIIQLTDDGIIQEMEQRWLSSNLECRDPDRSGSPSRVSLRSFLVLFTITGCVTLTCLVVSLLIDLHNERSFLQRISDFSANARSRILALYNYFKQNNPSSLPKTTNTKDEILQMAEIGSSS